MNTQTSTYSPERNEGMLTPEYLQATPDEVYHTNSVQSFGAQENAQPTKEQTLESFIAEQKLSIAENSSIISQIYQQKLESDRLRYLEKPQKGFFVGKVRKVLGKVLGYIFDDVLKFPTSTPRPAVTMMDVQRQAGKLGGSLLETSPGKINYFWFSPDATNTSHKGELVYMQLAGNEVEAHIHYPIIYDASTNEAEVTKFVSRNLTNDSATKIIDLAPNQHRALDKEELTDLAIVVDNFRRLLSEVWNIKVEKTTGKQQKVSQVYQINQSSKAA